MSPPQASRAPGGARHEVPQALCPRPSFLLRRKFFNQKTHQGRHGWRSSLRPRGSHPSICSVQDPASVGRVSSPLTSSGEPHSTPPQSPLHSYFSGATKEHIQGGGCVEERGRRPPSTTGAWGQAVQRGGLWKETSPEDGRCKLL